MGDDCEVPAPDAVDELASLKLVMEQSHDIGDDLFFFPEFQGVKGYWGTDPVWFLGPKPSKGGPGFPSSADELLYETLAEYGFENAHITDLSKERGTVPDGGIPHEEITRIRPYFRREVEILQPEVILAMSRKMETALKYMAVTDGIEIGYVHHYSWADGRGDRETFVDDVQSHAECLGIDY